MFRRHLILPITIIALLTSISAAVEPRMPTAAEAEAAAAKWIDGLKDKKLVLSEQTGKDGFRAAPGNSALGNITKFTFDQAGYELAVTFRGDITRDTPLKELQKNLWHVVIDTVPTPGLDVPGWEIKPRTPTSSFDKGIEILSYGEGKIKLRIRTSFFALSGREPSLVIAADSAAPPGSFFQLRKNLPLDLMIEAPVEFSK